VILTILVLAIAPSTIAGCGGGSSVLSPINVRATPAPTAGPTGTSGLPPAALAQITPAPGLPTVPPTNLTAPAPTPLPSGLQPSSVTTGSVDVSYDDLSSPISSSLAQELANALPTPDPHQAAVFGTIVDFRSDGIDITETPILTLSSSAQPDTEEPLPASGIQKVQSIRLTGNTIDGVPGGFGAMRTGDLVFVGCDLTQQPAPVAAYATDLTKLAAGETYAQASAPAPQSRSERSDDSAAQPQNTPTSGSFSAPFTLAGKTGKLPILTLQDIPLYSGIPLPGGLTANITGTVTFAKGELANFPLELTNLCGCVAGQPNTLGVGAFNPGAPVGPLTSTTYSINNYVSWELAIVVSGPNGTEKFTTTQFLGPQQTTGQRIAIGFGLESSTALGLPGPGSTVALTPIRTISFGVSLQDVFAALSGTAPGLATELALKAGNVDLSLNIDAQYKAEINGGTLSGPFTISNASPGSGTVAFNIDNSLSPNSTTITPDVAPPNGPPPSDVFAFSNPVYGGTVTGQLAYQVSGSFTAGTFSAQSNLGNLVPLPLAEQGPNSALTTLTMNPNPVTLTLQPTASEDIVCGTATFQGSTTQQLCNYNGSFLVYGPILDVGQTATFNAGVYTTTASNAPVALDPRATEQLTVNLNYHDDFDDPQNRIPSCAAAGYSTIAPTSGSGPSISIVATGPSPANGSGTDDECYFSVNYPNLAPMAFVL
jgi:hypothetical protein